MAERGAGSSLAVVERTHAWAVQREERLLAAREAALHAAGVPEPLPHAAPTLYSAHHAAGYACVPAYHGRGLEPRYMTTTESMRERMAPPLPPPEDESTYLRQCAPLPEWAAPGLPR